MSCFFEESVFSGMPVRTKEKKFSMLPFEEVVRSRFLGDKKNYMAFARSISKRFDTGEPYSCKFGLFFTGFEYG